MPLSQTEIFYLLKVYTDGKATAKEQKEFFDWIEKGTGEEQIKEHIKKLLSEYDPNDHVPLTDWERLYHQISEEKNRQCTDPVVRKMPWVQWAAAAMIILLLGTGYYFLIHKGQQQQNEWVKIKKPAINDIAPPNTVNAVLTLGNGQRVILDSSGNGMLAVQGKVDVVKLSNDQIAYRGSSKDIQYNTLSNPRGSKVISLMLTDGSRVWLNSASSLTYPTVFTGNERKVKITGEAYFEVAHAPAMPFIISKGETSIKVLGTHFNVNAYDDESSLNVTLLEGSVSVCATGSHQAKVIKPGEQARVSKEGVIALANSIDIDEVMAWKNGLFSFKGSDIESIMRQLSRWYNVEVIFKKPVTEKFYAEVSKNTSISSLLEMLEATKAVHFAIEGNTISVMPGG